MVLQEKLHEEFRERNELEKRIDQEINKIAGPNNQKISEIEMNIIGPDEPNKMCSILLTELSNRINVTKYGVDYYEFSDYYNGRRRWIKQGHLPRNLYQWLWKFLESNNVWELKDTGSYNVLGLATYKIDISKENKKHSFSVYAPEFDKSLLKYTKIINRIDWLSYFAFSKAKGVQPVLDEISREEIENHHKTLMLRRKTDSKIRKQPIIYSGRIN